jgi:hypothetical protein
VVHLEPGLRGEPDAGPNTRGEEDGSRIESITIIEVHSEAAIRAFDASDSDSEAQIDAEVL